MDAPPVSGLRRLVLYVNDGTEHSAMEQRTDCMAMMQYKHHPIECIAVFRERQILCWIGRLTFLAHARGVSRAGNGLRPGPIWDKLAS